MSWSIGWDILLATRPPKASSTFEGFDRFPCNLNRQHILLDLHICPHLRRRSVLDPEASGSWVTLQARSHETQTNPHLLFVREKLLMSQQDEKDAGRRCFGSEGKPFLISKYIASSVEQKGICEGFSFGRGHISSTEILSPSQPQLESLKP